MLNKLITFLKQGSQRTVAFKRNVFYSLFIKCASIAINILFVPLLISYVDATKYGIWLTVSSVVAWLAFFDIGFTNGFRNEFAKALAERQYTRGKELVSSTYAVLSFIFFSIWLLFFIFYNKIPWTRVFNAPLNLETELNQLVLIVFTYFCLQFVLKIGSVLLIADQAPAKSAFYDLFGQLFSFIIIFIISRCLPGSLLYLGLGLCIAPLFVLMSVNIYLFMTKYKRFSPSFAAINLSSMKGIMQLGVNFFVIQIATLLIYQSNNIIIAQLFGPESVTVYNVAFKYFSVFSMLYMIFLTPLWSAFTDAFVQKDYQWMDSSYRQLKKIFIVFTIFIFVALGLASFIYKIWIRDNVVIPFDISLWIALATIFTLWNNLHSNILNGIGKIRLQLIFAVINGVINVPLCILLGKHIGLSGVLISGLILNIVSAVYSPIQVNRILKNEAKGIWNA